MNPLSKLGSASLSRLDGGRRALQLGLAALRRYRIEAAALVAGLCALAYIVEASRYPRGTAAQPGAGLYPLLVGGVALVGAIGTGLEARLRSASDATWPAGPTVRTLLSVLIVSVYVIAVPYIGHLYLAAIASLVLLKVQGLRSWPGAISIAVGLAVGSQLLFADVLGVPLETLKVP
jgi:putative tricarboxylic transport membrane protein